MSLMPKRINFEDTWGELRQTVMGVITLAAVQKTIWSDRFSDVYNLCEAYPDSYGDRLYTETKTFLELHVQELHGSVCRGNGGDLLARYHSCWLEYSRGTEYLNRLFQYLNNQHIKKQKFSDADLTYGSISVELQEQMLEIGELGLDLWRKHMIDPLRANLVNLLLAAIKSDRSGESVNQVVIQGVIESFIRVEEYKRKNAMEMYIKMFEEPFLAATSEYYQLEASRLRQDCDISIYMEKVIQRLDEENLRSRKFLNPISYTKVTTECQQRMVADHMAYLHSECPSMVRSERRRDLQNLYTLLKPVSGGLSVLMNEILEHIKSQGLEAVSNLKGENIPAQYVENMLQVHRKYTELISSVFSNDQQFVGALDKACSAVINHRSNQKQICRSPELLAKYCDSLLKKSARGISETEMDDKLSSSITIFKYIDDKDVFQKFYSRTLAKRLIHGQSVSMDAEESMINRLKQACGYEFTNKLHRMFTDINLSSDLNNKFSTYLKEKEYELGIGFSIYVLQAGAWPLNQSNQTQFAIPQELERSVQMFETFYSSKFNGRKLTWLHNLCTAEVRLGYLRRQYTVSMGTFQMAILLLFETTETLNLSFIQQHTQLNTDHLQRNLASLIESKLLLGPVSWRSDNLSSLCGVLFQSTVEEDSIFSLNLEYTNKRTKFKITTAIQKETTQEVESTHSSVEEDRNLYLQATVVRIMKARKIFRHNALIEEVINQSRPRFAPSIQMIKKCIESLIDKQYLERTPNSNDEYSYMA